MFAFGGTRRPHRTKVSLVVALLHFAAVTWIPIVHPFIHPDAPLPVFLNAVDSPSDQQDSNAAAETDCFICQAGQQFSAVKDQRLPFDVGIPWRLPLNTTVYLTTPHTDTPANSARGPPTSY